MQLAPDDSLTFLSDGVVEARNGDGELFGFERSTDISGNPVEEIAGAAQTFLQEDDITVLRLEFVGEAVETGTGGLRTGDCGLETGFLFGRGMILPCGNCLGSFA